jgi:hypothetical protein
VTCFAPNISNLKRRATPTTVEASGNEANSSGLLRAYTERAMCMETKRLGGDSRSFFVSSS